MMFAVLFTKETIAKLNKLFVVMLTKLTVLFYDLAVTIPLVMFNPDRGNLVANDEEDRPHNAKKLSGSRICH